MKIKFRRIWDAASGYEVHVSEDVRYAIQPVMTGSPVYEGWCVYDIQAGALVESAEGVPARFMTLNDAKSEVERLGAAT